MPKDIDQLYNTGGGVKTGLSDLDKTIQGQEDAARAQKRDRTPQTLDAIFRGVGAIAGELGQINRRNQIYNTGVQIQEQTETHLKKIRELKVEPRLDKTTTFEEMTKNASDNFYKKMLAVTGDKILTDKMTRQYTANVAREFHKIANTTQKEYSKVVQRRVQDASNAVYSAARNAGPNDSATSILNKHAPYISESMPNSKVIQEQTNKDLGHQIFRGKMDSLIAKGEKERAAEVLKIYNQGGILSPKEYNYYNNRINGITKDDGRKYSTNLMLKAMNDAPTWIKTSTNLINNGDIIPAVAKWNNEIYNLVNTISGVDPDSNAIWELTEKLGFNPELTQKMHKGVVELLRKFKKIQLEDPVEYNQMMGAKRGPYVLTNKERKNLFDAVKKFNGGTITLDDFRQVFNIPGVDVNTTMAAMFAGDGTRKDKQQLAFMILHQNGEWNSFEQLNDPNDRPKLMAIQNQAFERYPRWDIAKWVNATKQDGSTDTQLTQVGKGNGFMNRIALTMRAMELAYDDQKPGFLGRLFGKTEDPVDRREFVKNVQDKLQEAYNMLVSENKNAIRASVQTNETRTSVVVNIPKELDNQSGSGVKVDSETPPRDLVAVKRFQVNLEAKQKLEKDNQANDWGATDEAIKEFVAEVSDIYGNTLTDGSGSYLDGSAVNRNGSIVGVSLLRQTNDGTLIQPVKTIDGEDVKVPVVEAIKEKNYLLKQTKKSKHLIQQLKDFLPDAGWKDVLRQQGVEGNTPEKIKKTVDAIFRNIKRGSILGSGFNDNSYEYYHVLRIAMLESKMGTVNTNKPGSVAVGPFQIHRNHFKLSGGMSAEDKIKFWRQQNNSVVANTINGVTLMRNHADIIRKRMGSVNGLYAHSFRNKKGEVIGKISFNKFIKTVPGLRTLTNNDFAVMAAAHYNGGVIFNDKRSALGFLRGELYQSSSSKNVKHVRENVGYMLNLIGLQGSAAPRNDKGIITNKRVKDFLKYVVHLNDGTSVSVQNLLGENRVQKIIDNNLYDEFGVRTGERTENGFGQLQYLN